MCASSVYLSCRFWTQERARAVELERIRKDEEIEAMRLERDRAKQALEPLRQTLPAIEETLEHTYGYVSVRVVGARV
jgi:hypothetical protein